MKICCFDTESSDLTANWGRLLCCSYSVNDEPVFTHRADDFKRKDINDDAALAVAIRDTLEQMDVVVGWNSVMHDVPLVNARLILAGERPMRLTKYDAGVTHVDLMYYARGSFMKVGGAKLDTIAHFMDTKHQKTMIDGDLWNLALSGDRKAMDEIVVHCEADVEVLRDLLPILGQNVKKHQVTLADVLPLAGFKAPSE